MAKPNRADTTNFSREPMDKPPSKRAMQLWRRLAQSYGTRLADQYGAKPPPDWCAVFDRTDDARLTAAVQRVRTEHPKFVPTLGQFEACIAPRSLGRDQASTPDMLARYAATNLRLCRHQLATPWSYFGRYEETGSAHRQPVTGGVVIPACALKNCKEGGGTSHRVLLQDIA